MALLSEDYIKTILTAVSGLYNLKEWHYIRREFESIAQNYFGVLIPVNLIGKNENEDVNIPLVLKLAPTDERFRVSGAVTQFFAREIYVYSEVFVKYRQYQNRYPKSRYAIPKLYYTNKEYCKEVLVMQDMCVEGYTPFTERLFLDYNHVRISLKSLAKFHALSFLLKGTDSDVYSEAIKQCVPLTGHTNKRFMEIMTDRLEKAIVKFSDSKYVPLLENYKANCVQIIEATDTDVNETCLCHGDIWKENILFKYENNLPVSACLIDFQTARKCSPAFDVLYLITSSTNKELRKSYFGQMTDEYFGQFTQCLEEAGLDTAMTYSRQAFDCDLKVVAPACVIVVNTALWLANGLQQEGHVRSKIILTTEEEKTRAAESYKEMIKDIIDDYCALSYLDSSCLK